MSNIPEMISLCWRLYTAKVASGLLKPDNEKMMQLQLAQMLQAISPLFEASEKEFYKILLEVPVRVGEAKNVIDIVVQHSRGDITTNTAIELKCFRLYTREGGGKRSAQNLGMYDYWADIEKCEGYCTLPFYDAAYQLTLTDDPYYVETKHGGSQVAMYSTNRLRSCVTGTLEHKIANRIGLVRLQGIYSMAKWMKCEEFYFIIQSTSA